jgi:hypothetical protein
MENCVAGFCTCMLTPVLHDTTCVTRCTVACHVAACMQVSVLLAAVLLAGGPDRSVHHRQAGVFL